jgi:hypothetical protein
MTRTEGSPAPVTAIDLAMCGPASGVLGDRPIARVGDGRRDVTDVPIGQDRERCGAGVEGNPVDFAA